MCVDRAEPRRLLLTDHAGHLVHGQLFEPIWQPIRQQFEENHSERIDVRSRIEAARVGGDLFGTHITQRAEQLAGLGATRRSQQVGRGHVGHAEVDDLGLARFVDQDVGRFQVAMNDAPVMGVLHRVAHPGHQFQPRVASRWRLRA